MNSWGCNHGIKIQELVAVSFASIFLGVGTAWFLLNSYSRNVIFGHFSKICREDSVFIKIGQE